jgi:anti-sigma B factor antagonist
MASLEYPIEMVNGVPVVAAPAEIDIRNADWLDAVLREAAARGHATFVVDMTGTTPCESSGVGVLAQAHKRALAQGGELRLVIPASAFVLRKFALTGIDRVIPTFPSLYEAVEPAPATAPQPPRPRRHAKPGMRTRPGRPPADPAPGPARPDGPPVRCRARAVSN